MTKIEIAAQTVVLKCLDVKKDEPVLVLANEPLMDIAHILFKAASRRTHKTYLLQLSHFSHQNGLFDPLARMMSEFRAIIAVTSPSILHTEARIRATQNGTRIANMPEISNQTFSRLAGANFIKINRLSQKVKDILSIGKEVKISAPNGTELYIPIRQNAGFADTGLLHHPGSFSELPAGESAIIPDENKMEGMLVVDCGMGVNKADKDRLVLTIKDGRISRISGGTAAQKLRRQLGKFGPQSRNIVKFGIGTNDAARINGFPLEDKKVRGTIHLAIGNNISFGGHVNIPIHLESIVYKASVEIDGRKIIDRGKMVLNL
ncbi:MAG: aminopeptidase [Calditrichaeota bacterium]|nr:aminopeptidase [Calditrichota bacterium]